MVDSFIKAQSNIYFSKFIYFIAFSRKDVMNLVIEDHNLRQTARSFSPCACSVVSINLCSDLKRNANIANIGLATMNEIYTICKEWRGQRNLHPLFLFSTVLR